jgi:autonomous glycyl radical cofactor GrcA
MLPWVRFDAATTFAKGDYSDQAQGVATTLGKLAFDEAPTDTQVTATVSGLNVLDRFTVSQLAIGITSHNPAGFGQLPIRLEGNSITGVAVEGFALKVTLAEGFFQECDTLEKLEAKFNAGLPENELRLFLPLVPGEPVTEFPEADGCVQCTIVQDLAWAGPAHPTAQIEGHVVVLPNFGKIYFGEVFITECSRRVTMVRFQLGSDDGGEGSGGSGETNGSTWPPPDPPPTTGPPGP